MCGPSAEPKIIPPQPASPAKNAPETDHDAFRPLPPGVEILRTTHGSARLTCSALSSLSPAAVITVGASIGLHGFSSDWAFYRDDLEILGIDPGGSVNGPIVV